MINGINHITISVKNINTAFIFYKDVLKLKPVMKSNRSAYFLAGKIWIALDQQEKYIISENYLYECMKDAAHDPEHIFRVLYLSLNIASKRIEKINFDILIASCLLHDIGREAQFKNHNICHAEIGGTMAKEFLLKNEYITE